ncbi:MAG TPA: CHAT domain-containing protein [Candidatus Angelobacter sp.]|nr:CHAT domain-containing protein [Candidatus Angelobacter sp.]
MSKLYQFGKAGDSNPNGPCPPPAIWAEVITGLMPRNAALRHLEHAATCSVCSEELQNALYAVGDNAPAPEDLQAQLQTASQEWQRKFAGKIALKEFTTTTGRPRKVVSSGTKVRFFSPVRWSVGTAVALIVLAVGLGLFFRGHHNSPDALIHQAYAQQRTMEMMIPGASYGPIQVERASGQSSISSPRPLLEAEVLIKSGLEKTPNDPELLRQKAEADLLTGNYQPAIDTLNHAVHLNPGSVPLLVDLATAYFERAEANSSPADYETGLEALGNAIRREPSNPAALFNRAILYERLYFYDRAIADLEQFLKLEQDQRWRQEAEQRLKEIRLRQSQHGLNVAPDKLPPGQFQQEVAGGGAVAIEEYIEAAERVVLPNIRDRMSQDEHYQAALTLAQNLRSLHSDPFLADLLLSAGQNDFAQATLALSQSSWANHGGHFENAHSEALRAAALFRKSGNSAGWLAALFEQSYALQFESQAGACQSLAAQAADDAHRLGYVFLEIQLRLEYAICSNMKEHLGQAKQIVQRALVMAKDHGYQSLYLRALNLLAGLESDAGDDARAWSAVQEGLALYWKAGLPQVRAYSLYAVLDLMAGRLGHANVQFAALSEALKFRANNMNRVVEAAAHARLGNAALQLGDLAVAEAQFAEAQSIFASEPQTDSVRWRELEARINLARVQAMHGQDTSRAATLLTNALPEVETLSNRYLEFLYYDTLAELKMRAGDTTLASQSLERAINIAETGAQSLSTWQERAAWMEMHRQPFVSMTMLLLKSGNPEHALELWQRFRAAGALQPALSGERAGKNRPASNLLRPVSASPVLQVRSYVLTYAFLHSGLIIWVHYGEEVHAVRVPATDRSLQRTAEDFISECSRPGSDLADLQANARILFQWLIQPVQQWLPLSGHLIVEPDGILSALPLEALIDENSKYLGERYAISMALNARANDGNEALKRTSYADNDRALIVTGAGPAPLPGAMAEAMHVAARFSHSDLLSGSDASVSRVAMDLARSTIFHFAGHSGASRDGATLLLADGVLRKAVSAQHLDHLQLAVFSACDTARPSDTSDSRGLVSDFLQAGTRNVVASRWNVDSLATEDFMDLFYDSLLSGHTPAAALEAAANSLRQMPGRAHPYYWAAFAAFVGA